MHVHRDGCMESVLTNVACVHLVLVFTQTMFFQFRLHFKVLVANITPVIVLFVVDFHVFLKVFVPLTRQPTCLTHVAPVVRVHK